MNIVNKVTLRHLKENKRRTMVTIIGVIISVAMITAVAALGMSFMDMNQREAKAEYGEWHYSVAGPLDAEQFKAIQSDDNTDSVGLVDEIGFSLINDDLVQPYVYVQAMDDAAMEQMHVKLTSGRLPANENEAVMSEALKDDYQVGDTVELTVGERYALDEELYAGQVLNQEYPLETLDGGIGEELRNQEERIFTIVGEIEEPSWDREWSPGRSFVSYLDKQSLSTIDQALVKVKKVKQAIFDDVEALAAANDLSVNSLNTNLLDSYMVSLNQGMVAYLTGLLTIIMLIVMIGSIALIYNAFAISVSERSRYLGMLASVGATKSQKRNSVLFEGLVIGVISIPIGIAAGLLGIGITLHFVSPLLEGAGMGEDLRLVVTVPAIVTAVVISFLTIMISAFIPALRASRITAIDAIRQAKDVKLTKKAVKTNRLVRKLFGYEADIALKNLKRNKKRYHVTVFSLMISIILFLSVGFFTSTLMKSFELQTDQQNYDISVELNDLEATKEPLEQILQSVDAMDNVQEAILYDQLSLLGYIPEAIAGEAMKESEWGDEVTEDGYSYNMQLIGLEESDWQEYLRHNNISDSSVDGTEAVLVNTVSYMNSANKYEETDMLPVKAGDKLPLNIEVYQEETEEWEVHHDGELELIGLTDNLPMGTFYPSVNTLFLIMNEQALQQLAADFSYHSDVMSRLYVASADPMQTEADIEALGAAEEVRVHNLYYYQQQDKQLALALSIFIYGFITLITLISIANIFNTISTSVALRKREFATMKSIGMTPKAFRKMIRFESIFYGVKSLLYGLPISIVIMYLIHLQTQHAFEYSFSLPWIYIGVVILAVFVIVGVAMLYSITKIKKDNIIETLRQENI
ncbi:ABC transporter permease [Gracilibacillus alcaliphilus]|uniref:ABC transporter permease n=1 Tax=Gracilibacillus alcaliphilus TaxID=1401441 RepID=UPI00195B2546|nr:FtsX-like permease family protein [Gracilibacillus alcaliphilus]MBM7676489.1 putative ABC transport system permease protein [Gracilibacillus alcaliphilus]